MGVVLLEQIKFSLGICKWSKNWLNVGCFPRYPQKSAFVINDTLVNIKTSSQIRSCCQVMCLSNWRISSVQAVENYCVLLCGSTPRTDIIQLAIFVLRMVEYKSSCFTDTSDEEERRGTGILNEFKKSVINKKWRIESVPATTDGSTGITRSKGSLLVIITEHSVETWVTLNIMGAMVNK